MVGRSDLPAGGGGPPPPPPNAALAEPAVRERLSTAGTDPRDDSTPESTRAFLVEEFARFREVVRRTGLQIE
ncbi:hypothetical protein NON00_03275 [Roseomonas sp. GC11]|uniref:hypothetical protein n=1 Tax=Roseomonas sp. GC11 TaxID=2950546 RepID=UPI00210C5ECD|nr:hypothetical protein [Roseomonas sp. GC11]MCQ4158945.1 hypothetical protein [Roseomonas sp. GC11]